MEKKTIRVGLIGMGFIGKVHAQAYRSLPFCYPDAGVRAEIAAILRTGTGRDEEFIASLGDPLVTTDASAFYGAGLDMVDICTPNFLHLEQAQVAAANGCHMYIEKPLGLNLAHARQMAATAKEKKVLTHTAFMKRYYPAVWQAKAIIESGMIGEITNFNVHYYHNSYMDPLRPITWRLKQEPSGGGALADLGVHIIDMTRYMLGEADWVRCHTRTFIKERPVEKGSDHMDSVDVDDWALCIAGMQNGAVGTIETTRMSGGMGDSNRMEIFGSEGSVVIDLKDPLHCRYYDRKTQQERTGELNLDLVAGYRDTRKLWPPAKMSLGSFMDAHSACILDFLQCIQQGRQSMTNFDDAVRSQEILEAAYRSAQQDAEMIRLPLE